MKNKVLRLIFGVLAIILPVIALFALLNHAGYGPLLTNSVSFDAKIRFINNRQLDQVDLLAIGSSFTVNNLNSTVMVDSLDTSFFNFGSWGLQMGDIKVLLENYIPRYRPKYVIIVSSLLDFTSDNNVTIDDYVRTSRYIKDHFPPYFYLENYNSIPDIIARKKELDQSAHGRDDYLKLDFDAWGGVPQMVRPEYIRPERWNESAAYPTNYTEKQFLALNSLCRMMKTAGVPLIFVQSPIKKLYVNTPASQQVVERHFSACKAILEKYGETYLNFHDTTVFGNDALFNDQFHLQETGATLFTKELAQALRPIIH